MSDGRRAYRKKRRAELEEETRLRITESAVALHGSVGPSRTSMSAIAEHAGVQRSTLYRHFPDEEAVFRACSAHWAMLNPPPDPSPWGEIEDAGERVRVALEEIYGYYRRNEQMLSNLHRDEEVVPMVKETFAAFRMYLDAARDVLVAGEARGRRLRAAIGHALAFPTWQSLVGEQGLSDRMAADLMARLAAVAHR